MTPADVRDAIVYCNAIAWGKVGAVVAALALTYGVAMSIALVVYVYLFRGRRMTRRRGQTRQAPQNERSLVRDCRCWTYRTRGAAAVRSPGPRNRGSLPFGWPATRQPPQKRSVLGLTAGANPPHPKGAGVRSPGQLAPPASPQGSFLRGPAVAAREVGEPVVGRLCPAPEPHKCPPPRLFAPAGISVTPRKVDQTDSRLNPTTWGCMAS
jgi:hypothetical protein